MTKKAWLLACTLVLLFKSYAQDHALVKNENNFPVSFVVSDSLPDEFNIDISRQVIICNSSAFEYFEKKGRLEYKKQITTGTFKKPFFDPVNEITLLLTLSNISAGEKNIYFHFGDADIIKLVNTADPDKHIQSGGFLGTSNKISPFSPNYYIPLKLPPKTVSTFLCYAKFIGTYRERLAPQLLSEKSYQLSSVREIDQMRLQLVYHSFILGGFLIISIFMFAQYFLNKDKAYLYYAAYGLCIFLLSEKIMEINCNINLISYFFPYYVFYSHVILQLLASFFYIGFLKRLLEISRRTKFLFLYTQISQQLILLGCILYLTVFFFKDTSVFTSVIYNYGAFVSSIIMLPLLVLLFLLKQKDLAVKFLITGLTIVVASVLTVIYINRSGLYTSFKFLAPVSIIEFGFFAEMIFFGLALGYKIHRQKKEKLQIEQQITETKIAALKAQMNPHFMFNCINSIDAFIQSNDKYNATLYLNKFAKLIRNVLDSSKQNAVNFSRDIDTLTLYLELEELRHEKKFSTTMDIDPELMNSDYKVPPLIVQPFVENAILHGLKNKAGNNGHLHIAIRRNAGNIEYTITDNGIGRTAAAAIAQNKESSYGMELSFDRIKLFNKEKTPSVVIEDLYTDGKACGTTVKVLLKII